MGDHVVELAGDPRALLVGGQAPVLISIPFEPRGSLLELGDVGPPGSKVVADQPGPREKEARDGDDDRSGISRDAERHEAGEEAQGGDDEEDDPTRARVRRDAVHRNQQANTRRARIEPEQDLGPKGPGHEKQHRARLLPAPEQGNRLHQDQDAADEEG